LHAHRIRFIALPFTAGSSQPLTSPKKLKFLIHDKKVYGGMEIKLYRFLILELDKHEWSVSCPSHTTPRRKSPLTQRRAG
jgi:hypothetical protein